PGAVDDDAGVAAQDWAPVVRWTASPQALFVLSSEYFAENRRNGTVLEVNGTRLRQLALRGIVAAHGLWDGSVFAQSEDFDSTFTSIAADRNSEKLVLQQQVPSRASGAALDWSLAGTGWNLLAGGSYTHVTAVDNEMTPAFPTQPTRAENGRQRLGGGFTELSWSPLAHWSVTATLRRDGWSNYDAFQAAPSGLTNYPARHASAWSPSLGGVWAARPWLSLRASAYQSFRAPTLNELYRPFRVGNILTESNPLLAAERYRGAQAGAVASLPHALRLHATYFDGWVSNLVTSVTLSQTAKQITDQRQNLGRVRPRGLILGLAWQPLAPVNLWADYTHLDARVLSALQPQLVGLIPPHEPANNFDARALLRARGWTFSLAQRFGGSSFDDALNQFPLPSFWTTDVFLSRAFAARWGRWSPYLAATNLFNRRYAVEVTPGDLLNAPRTLTAGLRLRWGDL
ncbi:MAG: TonB-dependent receptor, partial [Terriglobales bacterium]